jgi:hypothetical protein
MAILPFISLSSVRWRMARVMVPYPFPSLWLSHCGLYWPALGLLALARLARRWLGAGLACSWLATCSPGGKAPCGARNP